MQQNYDTETVNNGYDEMCAEINRLNAEIERLKGAVLSEEEIRLTILSTLCDPETQTECEEEISELTKAIYKAQQDKLKEVK